MRSDWVLASIEHLERRMLLSLSPVGGEFRINTTTFGSQQNPAIAADGDGDFAVVWQSPFDGSDQGIFARRYNADGGDNFLGDDPVFQVNSYTTGNQTNPAIAMDGDGDFVVVWQSFGQDGSGDGIYAQRFNVSGIRRGIEFRVNTFTTGNQVSPVVAMDVDGDFVIAWTSDAQDGSGLGVYARRFSAAGIPQGPEFRVNTTTFHHQYFPSIAMDADGDFVIAWQSYGQDGSENGIYAQRYNASGIAQGGEFQVNSFTTGDQVAASVAMSLGGDFVIAWQSQNQDGSGSGVYAQRYNPAGTPQGGEFRVNTTTSGGQGAPAVTMDANGDFLVAWQGVFSGSNDIFAQHYNSLGQPQGGEFRVNTFTSFNQSFPAVAMDHQGDAIVAWQSDGQDGFGYGIYAQRYDESLDLAGPVVTDVLIGGDQVRPGERIVQHPSTLTLLMSETMRSSPSPLPPNSVINPNNYRLMRNGVDVSSQISFITATMNFSIRKYEVIVNFTAPLTDGQYVFTALDNLRDLVAGNPLDGDMNGLPGGDFHRGFNIAVPLPAGPEFRVNSTTIGAQRLPKVATDRAGNHVVVWQSPDADGTGIFAQRYNAAGAAVGGEFQVNTFTTGNQMQPVVAMDADGDFVVSWWGPGLGDADGIFAQRFNPAGQPLGSEFRVNSGTGAAQTRPSLGMDADGNFIVAWDSDGQDGSSTAVYARRYNAAGTAISNEFRVNTFTTGAQNSAAVAMDYIGNFIVTWSSNAQDGSGLGIYAQRYSAAGIPQHLEFRVNTYTTGSQLSPKVAMSAAGDILIAWSSSGQDGSSYGVYAQRYSAAGIPLGDEFRVNNTTTNGQFVHGLAIDDDGDSVIAWHSEHQDGSADATLARRYNALGEPQGDEFLVNTYTTQSQFAASVGMHPEGDFIIAWTSIGQDGSSDGVYAQRYGIAAPAIGQSAFLYQTAPHRLQFTFNQDVSASLGTNDLVLQNLTAGQTIPSNQFALVYDAGTHTATFTYTGSGGGIAGVLPDGNYRATLLASGITGPGGTPMASDHVFDFLFLSGDANNDGAVNLIDFNILATNFGQSPRDFSQGDFNFDGNVNLQDFNILASRFGTALPPASAGSAGSTGSAGSSQRLIDSLKDDLLG